VRANRKCGTCEWFEDKSDDFRKRYVPKDGLCHWKMPATVAADSAGWGDWHQKGPASVRKEDWCSCWQEAHIAYLEQRNRELSAVAIKTITK
jgi:hypothetical protein